MIVMMVRWPLQMWSDWNFGASDWNIEEAVEQPGWWERHGAAHDTVEGTLGMLLPALCDWCCTMSCALVQGLSSRPATGRWRKWRTRAPRTESGGCAERVPTITSFIKFAQSGPF